MRKILSASVLMVAALLCGCAGQNGPRPLPGRIYVVTENGKNFLLFYDTNNSCMAPLTAQVAPSRESIKSARVPGEKLPGNLYLLTSGEDTFLLFYDTNNSALCRLSAGSGAAPESVEARQIMKTDTPGKLYSIRAGSDTLLLFYDINNSAMQLLPK